MSKGLWTKAIDQPTGKAYYYNAARGQSCWQAPKDAIIHEAAGLLKSTEDKDKQNEDKKESQQEKTLIEAGEVSEEISNIESYADSFIQSLTGSAPTAPASAPTIPLPIASAVVGQIPFIPPVPVIAPFPVPLIPQPIAAVIPTIDINDRIQQALSKQRATLQTNVGSNKRFKNNHNEDEELTEYEKQKKELLRLQGKE